MIRSVVAVSTRSRRAVCCSVLIATASLGVPIPAFADSGYRYWSYWHGDTTEPGEWVYASEGSGTRVPADGDVEGWRFGVAGEASRIEPTVSSDFASICAGVTPTEGDKRVGIVIDAGLPDQAPAGERPSGTRIECVLAPTGATGYQVLMQIANVRTDAGFVCGIDGYPSQECAPLVDTSESQGQPPIPTSERTPASAGIGSTEDSDTASSLATPEAGAPDAGTPLVTAAAVSLLALAGFGWWRRTKKTKAEVS